MFRPKRVQTRPISGSVASVYDPSTVRALGSDSASVSAADGLVLAMEGNSFVS